MKHKFFLWIGLALASSPVMLHGQAPALRTLLERAHAQEQSGHIDLAAQTWQQVLLADPNNTEALSGLARSAKLAGNNVQAEMYLNRLRQVNPSDPAISRIQSLSSAKAQTQQLQQAAHLAQAGHPQEALRIYRQIWADGPPDGDWALAYYDTEASIPAEREAAIEALRVLTKKYPGDTRYALTFGRILTYSAKTRTEGERILRDHPQDVAAQAALRQALVWDAQNPGAAPAIREYLKEHKDEELAKAFAEAQAAASKGLARTDAERDAFDALAANKPELAQSRFAAIIAREPENPRALAGLGFVKMKQSDFAAAAAYFDRAGQNGLHDKTVETSLATSRFWNDVQQGTAALNENHFDQAESRYKAALAARPDSVDALNGLGGTYMKAGEAAQAVAMYQRLVKLQPTSVEAWRGLFIAQAQAERFSDALATEHTLPAALASKLGQDPEYLRNLAAAYSASGQDGEAQRVISQALSLPIPEGGRNMKAGLRLEYAELMVSGKRYEQAAGLYREILADDSMNVSAWQGLVSVQHEVGRDADAATTIERMPPAVYETAMQDTGFLSLAAAVYQQQNQFDTAQGFLERAANSAAAKGGPIPVPLQLQIAAMRLQQGDAAQAYAIFRAVLLIHPDRLDAWKGLMAALHQTGHDQDALAQMLQIPPDVRKSLERDPAYLQTVASIESATGHTMEALQLVTQVRVSYRAAGVMPPADIEIQTAWLLYNAGADAALDPASDAVRSADRDLYRTLMELGGRVDLTDSDRRRVQTIWASWSMRRASQAADNRNTRLALQILTAAQEAFPGNPDITKALAGGYLRAGQAKAAMAIYQSPELAESLANPTVSDYQGMIGAALALPNLNQAQTWLDAAMAAYPKDPQVLALAAKFEQARGDNAKAAAYWKASVAAMPPVSAANRLAHILDRPDIVKSAHSLKPANLASLLDPDAGAAPRTYSALPSYGNSVSYIATAQAPAQLYGPAPASTSAGSVQGSAAYTAPAAVTATSRDAAPPLEKAAPASAPQAVSVPDTAGTPHSAYKPQSSLQIPAAPSTSNPQASAPGHGATTLPNEGADPFAAPQLSGTHTHSGLSGHPTSPLDGLAVDGQPASSEAERAQLHLGITAANSEAHWETLSVSKAPSPMPDPSPIELTLDSSPAIRYVPDSSPAIEAYQHAASTLAQAMRSVNAAYSDPPAAPQMLAQAQILPGGQYFEQYSQPKQLQLPQPAMPAAPPANTTIAEMQQGPLTDTQQQQNLPPLRGPWGNRHVIRQRDPREEAEMQLATIEGGYSPWVGGTGYLTHRTGTVGLDQLTILEAPFEASTPLGGIARVTVVSTPSFLDSGVLDGSSKYQMGTLPVGATSQQQNASGVGGELQVSGANFGASAGYTPYEFLVHNFTGRFNWRPGAGPLTFTFNRDAVKDSQLSYAGLRDPGSATAKFSGNIWGGVVSNAANVQYSKGDAHSGLYAGIGGQYITGNHVETNHRIDGVAGGYWHLLAVPDTGDLTLGANFFGMHYANNLSYFTYGQGGYFSPSAYMVANAPVTWSGRSGVNLHYTVTGAIGLQAFQQEASPFFPLDAALQTASKNAYYPAESTVGANYDLHGEVSYHLNDHWYMGAFVALNNTRDFATQSIGFFIRFLGRPQYPSELGPTGLFPYQGNRPLMVP